jgi:hypothetical protein
VISDADETEDARGGQGKDRLGGVAGAGEPGELKLDEAEQAARDLLVRFPDVHDGHDRNDS